MKYSTQCKQFEINIFKIEICLTITKNNLIKNKCCLLFAGFKKKPCDKQTQTPPWDNIAFSLEHYVKFLRWISWKLVASYNLLNWTTSFLFFVFFHVDLVQILQGYKLPLGQYDHAGPDSTIENQEFRWVLSHWWSPVFFLRDSPLPPEKPEYLCLGLLTLCV